jgi:hypothetical protein
VSSWWDITSIWQIVPALALLATIIFYYKSRKIKSLGYEIVTDESLLTVDEELQGKIKVLYEDNPIEDLSLLIIKFLNNGNEPIKTGDFEELIKIKFSANVGVLSAEVIYVYPPTINAKIKLANNEVAIEPLLLNKGDSITIKMLLTGSKIYCKIPSHAHSLAYGNEHQFNVEDDFRLETRIIGVADIKEITDSFTIKISEKIKIEFNIKDIKIILIQILIAILILSLFKLNDHLKT